MNIRTKYSNISFESSTKGCKDELKFVHDVQISMSLVFRVHILDWLARGNRLWQPRRDRCRWQVALHSSPEMQLESRIVSHSNDVQKGSLEWARKKQRNGERERGRGREEAWVLPSISSSFEAFKLVSKLPSLWHSNVIPHVPTIAEQCLHCTFHPLAPLALLPPPSTPSFQLFRESALQPQKSLCFSYLPCGFDCSVVFQPIVLDTSSTRSYSPPHSHSTSPPTSYDFNFNFATWAFNCFQK